MQREQQFDLTSDAGLFVRRLTMDALGHQLVVDLLHETGDYRDPQLTPMSALRFMNAAI